jgi:hypothetical protein
MSFLCEEVLTTKNTKSAKFKIINWQNLRVLRDLRGEQNQGDYARIPTGKPNDAKFIGFGQTNSYLCALAPWREINPNPEKSVLAERAPK